MTLLDGQNIVQLNTLYEVRSKVGISNIDAQLGANLAVNSGSVDVYGSNSPTQPTALSEMTLEDLDTNISGITEFALLPRYIAFVQNTGTTTELVTTGLNVVERGSIS